MHQSWHEVDIFSDAYKIDWWVGFITLDDQLGLSNIYIYIYIYKEDRFSAT